MAGTIFGHIIVVDLLTGNMINYSDVDVVNVAWIPGTADLIVQSRFRQLEPGHNQGLFVLPYPYTTPERILPDLYLGDSRHKYDSLLINASAHHLYFVCGLDTSAGLCESEIGE